MFRVAGDALEDLHDLIEVVAADERRERLLQASAACGAGLLGPAALPALEKPALVVNALGAFLGGEKVFDLRARGERRFGYRRRERRRARRLGALIIAFGFVIDPLLLHWSFMVQSGTWRSVTLGRSAHRGQLPSMKSMSARGPPALPSIFGANTLWPSLPSVAAHQLNVLLARNSTSA